MFAQAIERVNGAPGPGDVVTVEDPEGHFLGRGYWSPKSAIPVRILTRDPDDALDGASLGRRLEEALAWRSSILDLPREDTTGYRLAHAEGDSLSGLVVDLLGDTAVVQFGSIGFKRREDEVFAQVARVTRAKTIIEAPSRLAKLEGFEAETRIVRGPDVTSLSFRERGLDIEVPMSVQQKTGYYFDQRDNRARIETLAKGRRVLDAFSYLGGFALAAARGGADRVITLDSSAPAVAAAAGIARHNGLDGQLEIRKADVKKALPELDRRRERFDMVIVDPPKLVPTKRHLKNGQRAYRRLNANAFRLVEPGGLLVTCSCSGAMTPELFTRMIALAARDARR